MLSDGTIALHFSGHGIKNSDEFFINPNDNLKNQGDLLIFENQDGLPFYLSETKLKSLLDTCNTPIQFVLIASCHSEKIGRVFHKAGAKHVICIRENDAIMDEASVLFANMFYSIVFG